MGNNIKSHFYAYISKIRWIQRWGLKRNTITENVMEHSWEVAVIAHALALIRNRFFDGKLDANAVATTALYHDCSEVITGDMPSPIKYHSAGIRDAYKEIEHQAETELLALLPKELQADFRAVLVEAGVPHEYHVIIKAADTLSAYLKCHSELSAGNREFSQAATDIGKRLVDLDLPEVSYFLEVFAPSYALTLDELLKPLNMGKSR
jgi:5'-deoxynucleotidase